MVRKNPKRVGKMPSTSEIKTSTNVNEFRIRKCVVRIKRVKVPSNDAVSKKTATPYNLRKCRVIMDDVNITPSKPLKIGKRRHTCHESVLESSFNSTVCLKTQGVTTRRKSIAHPPEKTPDHVVKTVSPQKKATAQDSAEQSPIVANTTSCRVQLKRMSIAHLGDKTRLVTAGQITDEDDNVRSNREHRFFHREQPLTRSRSSVTRHVYEFLSDSQIDDNALVQRQDPAADIIKKMIEDGKVCAITRKNGKCRKRTVKKKVRPVGRRKQCSLKDKTETKPSEVMAQFDQPLSPIYDVEPDSDDGDRNADESINFDVPVEVHAVGSPMSMAQFNQPMSPIYRLEPDSDNGDRNADESIHIDVPVEVHAVASPKSTPQFDQPLSPIYRLEPDSDNGDRNADESIHIDLPVEVHAVASPKPMAPKPNRTPVEGSYSPLARSLLQNGPQNTVEKRLQLLNMARKYFSTPINSKNAAAARNDVGLSSTIQHTERRPAVVSSPSGISSPWRVPDEVPLPNTFMFGFNTSHLPSYSSDHVRRSHVYVPDQPENEPVTEAVPIQSNNESISAVMDDQSIGSEANDSNGENIPPPKESTDPGSDKTAIPNGINDQENENAENFVQLPNPRRTLQQRAPLKDINVLEVVILPSWKNNLQNLKTPVKENVIRNHVHFESPSENTINISRQQQVSVPAERKQQSPRNLFGFEEFINDDDQEQCIEPTNQNTTLHEKLQRLKGLRPVEKELPQISKAAMRYDYDDLNSRTPKQLNLKQMLCSTMLETPTPALGINETTDLFKSVDPEATFDEKKPRRTYVRERPKRKRKRVHVLFVDSDSSESEEEQNSHDKSAESPGKSAPVKKRVRRDVEYEKQLQNFVTSFNQQCEEVEKFPLIVE